MVGAFKAETHLLQHQADIPPDIFPLVQRRDIQITRLILGNPGRLSPVIGFKQIKLALRAYPAAQSRAAQFFRRLL